jgi:predicted transcriptional regulator
MIITLDPELEARLKTLAEKQGAALEDLVLEALRHFLKRAPIVIPQDEWERRLRSIATDCGVSIPDWALSSESLYD